MREGPRSHGRSALMGSVVLAIGAIVGGCTLALPYDVPPIESGESACSNGRDDDLDGPIDCDDADCERWCVEQTDALCSNGHDDDHDGRTDCEDPSCDGHCPERSPSACADGRDEDGDGEVDLDDPSCWPEATTSLTRCASLPGGRWVATFSHVDDGWSSDGAAISYVTDMTATFSHDVIEIPGGTTAEQLEPVTGGIVGAEIRATFASIATFWFGAVSTAAAPSDSLDEVRAEVAYPGGCVLSMLVDGSFVAANGSFSTMPSTTGWTDGRIGFASDHATLEVSDHTSGVVLCTATLTFGTPLGYGSALRFRASTRAGGRLGAASLARPAVTPCGADRPPAPSDANLEGSVQASAMTGDDLCVLVAADNGPFLRSIRSTDGGATFTVGGVVATSTGTRIIRGPCGALTYDSDAGEYVAVVRSFQDQMPAGAAVTRSSDCVHWASVPVADDASWPLCVRGIALHLVAGARADELWSWSVDASSRGAVRYVTSGALDASSSWTADPPITIPSAMNSHAPTEIIPFAGDLILGHDAGGGHALTILDRRAHDERTWIDIAPSRIEGECDSVLLYPAAFAMDRLHPTRSALTFTCAAVPGHPLAVVDPLTIGPAP